MSSPKFETIRLQRAQERVAAEVPVSIDGRIVGMTRNVSPSGIFFEAKDGIATGGTLRFTLTFAQPSGQLLLECVGEIVRVEEGDGKLGLAVTIAESRLERCE
jgi:hypothetical protein